jgi:hypothetical protein
MNTFATENGYVVSVKCSVKKKGVLKHVCIINVSGVGIIA